MGNKYAGRNGLVYLGVGSTAYAMAQLKEWTIDRKTDKIPTTCMGDSNKTYVLGLPDMQGTMSGFWDAADDQLFTASEQTSAVNMYIYPSSTTQTKYFYGTAFVDFSLKGGESTAVELSGTWAAASSWGRK